MTTDELKGFGLTDEQCQQVENLHNGEISSLQGQIGEKDTTISGLNQLHKTMLSEYTILYKKYTKLFINFCNVLLY